ncbi:WD40-repeat-containing domain protein [Armillaria novae-zelandiae]|uniref:WD40-repeat-containing domain protein n=1 Tax=Armillaria novae-zelandiae TaxID=153914 RepID=A0AA39UCZ6_9AGAR|nr:WD40-repeat-containing domain protein [Armillaria novae-zelandiae]
MSQTLRYKLVNRLKGHRGAINALVFLADGTKLLSGADDQTVRYWDFDKGECIQELRNERWGQITALNTYQHDQSTFLFEFITQAITTSAIFKMNDSIEVQALDAKNDRFVIGSHSGVVKMYDILNGHTSSRLSEGPKLCIDATSTGLEHPLNTLSTRKLQGANGSAKLSPNQRVMAVHNLNSGHFDIYNPFDTEQPITSLTVSEGSNPSGHLMKYCSFAEEEACALVCSGDEGLLHVFQVATGPHVQTLRHNHDCSTIYTVVTLSTQDQHFIASGESQEWLAICVWSKPSDQKYVADCLARRIKEMEDVQALE